MTKSFFNSLSQPEKNYYTDYLIRLQKMRDQREFPYREFDNLTYTQRYDQNRIAHLAYTDKSVLVNENNTGDSITSNYQMTAGVTRTKDKSVISHLLSFDFECSISAYDQENKLVVDLGESMEDLVNRSAEIENWDDKRRDVYDEFVAQWNIFVCESYEKIPVVIHDNGNWKIGDKVSDYKKDPYKIIKWNPVCRRQLILGKNVYLADIHQRFIQQQPEVAIYEEMPWSEASKRFSRWDRWEFVKATRGKKPASAIDTIIQQDQNSGTGIWGADDNYWNIQTPIDSLGILRVFNNVDKTYMIFMNGIMMLPIGYSSYEVSPSGAIPIAKGDAEVIPGFAYAKWQPDNILVDDKMISSCYNAITTKMNQSAKPTMGNLSGKKFPKWLLYSSRLIDGVRAGQLQPLLPPEARSITPTDTTFMDMARQILNAKSVDDAFSGDPVDVKTATEFLERKKNTIMVLFSMVEWLAEFEEQAARLRIAAICAMWAVPEETPYSEEVKETVEGIEQVMKIVKKKKVYRKEFVPTQFKDSGKDGFRDIRFFWNEETLPDAYDIAKQEDDMEEKIGKPVRLSYINSEQMQRLFEWTWKIDIIQKLEEDTKLQKLAYLDNKQRIVNLFGVETLNKEYTLQRFASMDWEDPDKAYNLEPTPQPGQTPQPWSVPPAIDNPVANIPTLV